MQLQTNDIIASSELLICCVKCFWSIDVQQCCMCFLNARTSRSVFRQILAILMYKKKKKSFWHGFLTERHLFFLIHPADSSVFFRRGWHSAFSHYTTWTYWEKWTDSWQKKQKTKTRTDSENNRTIRSFHAGICSICA